MKGIGATRFSIMFQLFEGMIDVPWIFHVNTGHMYRRARFPLVSLVYIFFPWLHTVATCRSKINTLSDIINRPASNLLIAYALWSNKCCRLAFRGRKGEIYIGSSQRCVRDNVAVARPTTSVIQCPVVKWVCVHDINQLINHLMGTSHQSGTGSRGYACLSALLQHALWEISNLWGAIVRLQCWPLIHIHVYIFFQSHYFCYLRQASWPT